MVAQLRKNNENIKKKFMIYLNKKEKNDKIK